MKLDDSHKKNIYKVPEGYFDELPGRIQKKIQAEKPNAVLPSFNWSLVYKIAAPVTAVILLLFIFVINPKSDEQPQLSYQQLLDEISSEEMITFLEIEGITSDEILLNIDPELLEYELEDMNNEFMEMEEVIDDALFDAIIDEYDFDIDNI